MNKKTDDSVKWFYVPLLTGKKESLRKWQKKATTVLVPSMYNFPKRYFVVFFFYFFFFFVVAFLNFFYFCFEFTFSFIVTL